MIRDEDKEEIKEIMEDVLYERATKRWEYTLLICSMIMIFVFGILFGLVILLLVL